jgi:hypothetical protein
VLFRATNKIAESKKEGAQQHKRQRQPSSPTAKRVQMRVVVSRFIFPGVILVCVGVGVGEGEGEGRG